jgi:serine/threonine protein kinase
VRRTPKRVDPYGAFVRPARIIHAKRLALAPGTRLGVYDVTAQIGAGGMGEVYTGRDTRLDRTVAIKVLPEALAADP